MTLQTQSAILDERRQGRGQVDWQLLESKQQRLERAKGVGRLHGHGLEQDAQHHALRGHDRDEQGQLHRDDLYRFEQATHLGRLGPLPLLEFGPERSDRGRARQVQVDSRKTVGPGHRPTGSPTGDRQRSQPHRDAQPAVFESVGLLPSNGFVRVGSRWIQGWQVP